jgi:hypothetical protein
MALPEVYIPSFYNAMQQGRADKRTAMINALQDEFMVSQKQRAEQEGAMLNEQKKAQVTYSILSQIEKTPEANRAEVYAIAYPKLQELNPDMQLPDAYSASALSGLKIKAKSILPRSVEKVGDQLVVVQGDEAFPIAGAPKSDFKTVKQTYIGKDNAIFETNVPVFKDMFGAIHTGDQVTVEGYPYPVNLKDYEAWLQTNVSPEQFQQYLGTRVNIPVSQGQQTGAQRVPNFMPQGASKPSVPSPQNTAGRTNQGFAISEDEVPQPPAPKQLRFEDLVNPDGSIRVPQRQAPTIDYGDEPPPVAMQNPDMPEMGVNALMGDSMMPEGVNRFAMLAPYGSEPNRFGSPAVEGMEQAYVGTGRQVGRAPQPNQPNKVTKEDLMIRASQGDPQALAQINRIAEIERSVKGQKITDKVKLAYQEAKAETQSTRDMIASMRQARVDLANGRINLSTLSRASNVPLSILGMQSDTQDRTDTYISNMQAQANAILMQNKGVQTDGDAERAMKQIAQPLAYVNNKKMISALDNGINRLQKVYNIQLKKLADFNRQYPAIGGQ